MPRAQNFSQSTIYQIRCIESRKVIYIGSTTDFRKRGSRHKYTCKTESDGKYHLPVYIYIRENGGWDAYEVIPVEHLVLNNSVELRIAEQREMDRHAGLQNVHYAKRTKAEYLVDNKDKITELKKQYHAANRTVINEYKKQYRAANADAISEYAQQYRATNADAISEQKKQYYADNADAISLKSKVRVTCECGCIVAKCSLLRHTKTKKHNILIDKLNDEPIFLQAVAHDI
jgi:hypothetical protein